MSPCLAYFVPAEQRGDHTVLQVGTLRMLTMEPHRNNVQTSFAICQMRTLRIRIPHADDDVEVDLTLCGMRYAVCGMR
jgi:hypothetical protein